MSPNDRIYIAGHRGMVGSAIERNLRHRGFTRLVSRPSADLDLRNQAAVEAFFAAEQPEIVVLAAAKVGVIHANNTFPAEFIYDNLMMECNVIHQAYRSGVRKLLFLGSSCIYPRLCPQPIREDYLLTGPLETTNEAYAVAKIAGIELCRFYRRQYGCDFISAMPTNLYGPNDNFHLNNSHVLPALIRKFHEAKLRGDPEVVVWGSGQPRREFLHVDDLADACVYLLEHYSAEPHINVGTGQDLTIGELAELVRQIVGFKGAIRNDPSKPDGTPRKLLDVSRLKEQGWTARIDLSDGIRSTYEWYLAHQDDFRQA